MGVLVFFTIVLIGMALVQIQSTPHRIANYVIHIVLSVALYVGLLVLPTRLHWQWALVMLMFVLPGLLISVPRLVRTIRDVLRRRRAAPGPAPREQ